MERLRIRIPQVFMCIVETCYKYTFKEGSLCEKCCSYTRMRKEMAPAALPSQTEFIHSAALSRYLCG